MAQKCINCGSCYSACPHDGDKPRFPGARRLGPRLRFIFDSRDKGLDARLALVDHPNGVWGCDTHFECTKVCPRGIKVTKLINLMKREIKRRAAGGRK